MSKACSAVSGSQFFPLPGDFSFRRLSFRDDADTAGIMYLMPATNMIAKAEAITCLLSPPYSIYRDGIKKII